MSGSPKENAGDSEEKEASLPTQAILNVAMGVQNIAANSAPNHAPNHVIPQQLHPFAYNQHYSGVFPMVQQHGMIVALAQNIGQQKNIRQTIILPPPRQRLLALLLLTLQPQEEGKGWQKYSFYK